MNSITLSRLATQLHLLLVCGIFAVVHSTGSNAEAAEQSIYEKTLVAKQVTPDVTGLRKYLRALHPSEDQKDRAKQLIAKLGSDVYAEREQATADLLAMPALPVDELVAANQPGGDPETRWRTKSILEIGREQGAATLFAALKMIKLRELKGLAAEVLSVYAFCGKPHQRSAANEALRATSRSGDADLLRSALGSEDIDLRAAVVDALSAALGEQGEQDFLQILDDQQQPDRVKLAAARALADFGQRRSLQEFVALLDSEDILVRVQSSATLRYLTGQHFGFAAYDKPDRRAGVAGKWREWVVKNGESAELKLSLDEMGSSHGYLHGNTLLAYGYKNKVAEYDPSGKEIWSYPAKGAWSAEKLSNGNVLIAEYSQNRVIEVDNSGKVVWEYAARNALNARPLPNGNIIVSLHSPKNVVEVNRAKKTVWEITTPGNCCDAHKLENGNVVYCAGNVVIEVSPDKKTVWKYDCPGQPYGIQPLRNGNLLVCVLSGKVLEVNRDKKVVWEFAEPNAVDAMRLPNGNTLITGSKRFLEVTPEKKVVWTKDGCNYGSARR